MGLSGFGAGFDEVKTQAVVQRGMLRARRTQHIGSEPAVARAGFNQIKRIRNREFGIEDVERLGDLPLEQLAEQRPDVDAGKEIARASGLLGRAGVVAELGVVEREIHERVHRHRAAFTNHFFNRQSFLTGTNSSF